MGGTGEKHGAAVSERLLTRRGRETAIFAAFVAVVAAGHGLVAGFGLVDLVNIAVLTVFWFVAICALALAVVLPFRYFRHRRALASAIKEGADLERRARGGDAVARVSLSRAISRDPRTTPWWRW